MRNQFLNTLLLVLTLVVPTSVMAEINILASSPEGSWSLREETTIDHKGRESVAVIRTSMLGSETRDGEDYRWMEMVMETYKVKKEKRKKDGERTIMKMLIAESSLTADPANAMANLKGVGKEIIMQTGDNDPMKMSGAGSLADGLMKGMGAEINYEFAELGKEKVTVPAGTFNAMKLQGTGSTEMKVIFKTIKVNSSTTTYYSDKVPFGIVKSEGETTTNGDVSKHSTVLLEFGTSGATSQITGEVQEMPEIPSMGDLFGGGK